MFLHCQGSARVTGENKNCKNPVEKQQKKPQQSNNAQFVHVFFCTCSNSRKKWEDKFVKANQSRQRDILLLKMLRRSREEVTYTQQCFSEFFHYLFLKSKRKSEKISRPNSKTKTNYLANKRPGSDMNVRD